MVLSSLLDAMFWVMTDLVPDAVESAVELLLLCISFTATAVHTTFHLCSLLFETLAGVFVTVLELAGVVLTSFIPRMFGFVAAAASTAVSVVFSSFSYLYWLLWTGCGVLYDTVAFSLSSLASVLRIVGRGASALASGCLSIASFVGDGVCSLSHTLVSGAEFLSSAVYGGRTSEKEEVFERVEQQETEGFWSTFSSAVGTVSNLSHTLVSGARDLLSRVVYGSEEEEEVEKEREGLGSYGLPTVQLDWWNLLQLLALSAVLVAVVSLLTVAGWRYRALVRLVAQWFVYLPRLLLWQLRWWRLRRLQCQRERELRLYVAHQLRVGGAGNYGGHLLETNSEESDGGHLLETNSEESDGGHLLEAISEGSDGGHLLEAISEGSDEGHLLEISSEGSDDGHQLETSSEGSDGGHELETNSARVIGGHQLETGGTRASGGHQLGTRSRRTQVGTSSEGGHQLGTRASGGHQLETGGTRASGGHQLETGGTRVSGGHQLEIGGTRVSGGHQLETGGTRASGGHQLGTRSRVSGGHQLGSSGTLPVDGDYQGRYSNDLWSESGVRQRYSSESRRERYNVPHSRRYSSGSRRESGVTDRYTSESRRERYSSVPDRYTSESRWERYSSVPDRYTSESRRERREPHSRSSESRRESGVIYRSGSRRENTGSRRENTESRRENTESRRENTGSRRENTGSRRENTGSRRENTESWINTATNQPGRGPNYSPRRAGFSPPHHPPSSPEEEGDQSRLCIVCMDKEKQVLLRPCSHYCVCKTCSDMLRGVCPICREPIQSSEVVHIFYD